MSILLEKALEKVAALPQDEQDAIAAEILASLAEEDAWKKRFAAKRDVILHMAQEAIEEDERGETLPLYADTQRDARRAYRLFQRNPAHPALIWYWIGSHAEYGRLVVLRGDWLANEY